MVVHKKENPPLYIEREKKKEKNEKEKDVEQKHERNWVSIESMEVNKKWT